MIALVGIVSIPAVTFLAIINPFAHYEGYGFGVFEDALAVIALIHLIAIIVMLGLIVLLTVRTEDYKLSTPFKIGLFYYTIVTIIASNEPGFDQLCNSIVWLFKT